MYSATHRNGKRAAIKLLHQELTVEPDVVARFLREGYVANKIDHPGAVAIIDDDKTEDGAVFLIMELLEGRPSSGSCEKKDRARPKKRFASPKSSSMCSRPRTKRRSSIATSSQRTFF